MPVLITPNRLQFTHTPSKTDARLRLNSQYTSTRTLTMGWKQIVCITTLALLVGQSESSSSQTKTPTTTPTPPINHIYNCSMDGTIIVKTTGAMANSPRIAIGQNKDESSILKFVSPDPNKCQFAGPGQDSEIILTHCDTKKPIYVYLMNQNSSNIVGGKNNHAYELNCYFPKEGFQRVVTAGPISVNQTDAYSHETHAFDLGNIGLTMTITPQTPHLGDTLTLNISETNTDLYVLPTECTATGTGTGTAEEQQLLTNGKAVDVNLLEKFDITKKGSAVAHMYAFRFKTSDVVRVKCTVTVCQTTECGGAYTTTTMATAAPVTNGTITGRRRRRSVDKATPGRTYDVSAAFEILDNNPNERSSSSTSVRVNPFLIGLSLLCLWAGASRKTY